MAGKGQMTGMLGVYMAAAELTRRGFIVSPTSRSAAGADLLVTDQACRKAWSVQVKTNRNAANFWLIGAHAAKLRSDSHIYIFVNLKGERRPDYLVVKSDYVASKVFTSTAKTGSVWYSFLRKDRPYEGEGWNDVFADPNGPADVDEQGEPSSDKILD
jgi:hypothetical protein